MVTREAEVADAVAAVAAVAVSVAVAAETAEAMEADRDFKNVPCAIKYHPSARG